MPSLVIDIICIYDKRRENDKIVCTDSCPPPPLAADQMDNNLQSTMHYSGKCHKKKLRQFMQDYCRKNRIILPRKARELMKDTPAIPKTQAQVRMGWDQ